MTPKSAGRQAAFVTGASYGIGAATALALARDGYDVAVAATRIENLANVVTQLEATGARVVPMALDVRLPCRPISCSPTNRPAISTLTRPTRCLR